MISSDFASFSDLEILKINIEIEPLKTESIVSVVYADNRKDKNCEFYQREGSFSLPLNKIPCIFDTEEESIRSSSYSEIFRLTYKKRSKNVALYCLKNKYAIRNINVNISTPNSLLVKFKNFPILDNYFFIKTVDDIIFKSGVFLLNDEDLFSDFDQNKKYVLYPFTNMAADYGSVSCLGDFTHKINPDKLEDPYEEFFNNSFNTDLSGNCLKSFAHINTELFQKKYEIPYSREKFIQELVDSNFIDIGYSTVTEISHMCYSHMDFFIGISYLHNILSHKFTASDLIPPYIQNSALLDWKD